MASGESHRPSRDEPSGRRQFPRLQLRGSAGFAPASLSLPGGKDAHTYEHLKELKRRAANLLAGGCGSQMDARFG